MKKTVMDKICSSFDSFFDSEKKIAKYIINNYDKVVEMTVGQLASASGSSEASVSRFCKKIGVKGFHHLKISLAKGNTIPVAIDGAFKFNQIGKLALSSTIWETQIGYVCNLTRDDVVIAISNSGESSSVVISLETAKEQGATTISITNNEESTVASVSDYHITTATREKLFLDGYCFSRVTATAVIEILYLFLTSMNEQAYVNIAKHENKIAGDKL